jgi:hypothetical protein
MQTQIVKMINDFEHGRLSRRQLIAYLTGLLPRAWARPSASPISKTDAPHRSRRTRPPRLMPPISITSR